MVLSGIVLEDPVPQKEVVKRVVILLTECWDYPDDSTVLPISRYRRSKARLLLLSTGVAAHLRSTATVGVTSIFTNRSLLQSNYKTWGNWEPHTKISLLRRSHISPASRWILGKSTDWRPARSAIKAPTHSLVGHSVTITMSTWPSTTDTPVSNQYNNPVSLHQYSRI